jgi:hypothetical protein
MYFKKRENNHGGNNKRGSTIVRGARCIIKKVGVTSEEQPQPQGEQQANSRDVE